ncbi:MAG: hypothetical protein ACI86M_001816 [Saprospiraceae bacterium]|jgi:hypothetical protein
MLIFLLKNSVILEILRIGKIVSQRRKGRKGKEIREIGKIGGLEGWRVGGLTDKDAQQEVLRNLPQSVIDNNGLIVVDVFVTKAYILLLMTLNQKCDSKDFQLHG